MIGLCRCTKLTKEYEKGSERGGFFNLIEVFE